MASFFNKSDNENFELLFNGKTLSAWNNGKKVKEWNAYSGKNIQVENAPRGTVYMNNSKYQKEKGKGPTPEGVYTLGKFNRNMLTREAYKNLKENPADANSAMAQSSSALSTLTTAFFSDDFARGANPRAWGDYRAELIPTENTNTYGRTGMYLHGGETPGSAGCIDLTSNIYDVVKFIENQNLKNPIRLRVKYDD